MRLCRKLARERVNTDVQTFCFCFVVGGLALADGNRATAKRLFSEAGRAGGKIGGAARESFVRLDIVDAPGRYVDVAVFFAEEDVLLALKNRTEYALRDLVIGVNATINGAAISRTPALGRLAGNATVRVPGGVRYRGEDEVEVEARVR